MSDGGKGDKRRPENTAAFEDGYERIFGKPKVQRGRYVWDKQRGEYVSFDEFVPPADPDAPMVVADLPGYQSPVTGEWIDGRVQRREDLKRTGCRPYEGKEAETKEWKRQQSYEEKKVDAIRYETVARAFYALPESKRRALTRGR